MQDFDTALSLYREGKPFFHKLQLMRKEELMQLKAAGFKKVSILTAGEHNQPYNSCKACFKLQGNVLTIEEALETMPLPVKDCNFFLEGRKEGWCRCLYLPKA